MQKRIFDIVFGIALLPVVVIFMCFIALLIKLTSRGKVIYWSRRIGLNGVVFRMPKFRSMKSDGSGADSDAKNQLVFGGKFIRSSGLDELPQIYSIFKGDMSFVGPRPLIPEETDFISLRAQNNIDRIIPGLTGWAQINGRNELSPSEKIDFDLEYMNKQTLWFDLKILFITIIKIMK